MMTAKQALLMSAAGLDAYHYREPVRDVYAMFFNTAWCFILPGVEALQANEEGLLGKILTATKVAGPSNTHFLEGRELPAFLSEQAFKQVVYLGEGSEKVKTDLHGLRAWITADDIKMLLSNPECKKQLWMKMKAWV